LSYNNLLDVDAAVNLIAEFKNDAHFCHFKTQQRLWFGQNFNYEAYTAALACDPSALEEF
jgi:phosphoribosylaminoimidazolecarboxamide formyltransferase/IMP cyclohydrolase